MRNNYLVLGLLLSFFSCTEDSTFDIIEQPEENAPTTRSPGDDIYDALGYGYDITGEYLGEGSTRLRVLNVDLFVKNNKDRFDNPFVGVIDQRIYAGEDAKSFLDQIIKSSNFSGSVGSLPEKKDKGGFFSGTVTSGFKSETKYFYSTKYSFAKAEVFKKQRQYLLNTDIATLSRYLSPAFTEDLNKYSADKIVEMYGTHVLTNITVGGIYTAYYKSAIIEENSRTEKTTTVGAGAKYNFNKMGLDANGSWSSTAIKERNKKNTNWECHIKCLGGSTSGTSYTITPEQGITTTINLGAWTESVDDTHCRLVDVNWNATYPIYDLITDPIKKAELKVAVEKYIDSKKIEPLPIVPFYQYWGNGEHFYDQKYAPTAGNGEYRYEYVAWYLLNAPQKNTIPFHQYWGDGEHYYCASHNPAPSILNGLYRYEGVVGHIYDHYEPGTVPLYAYWGNGEHFYCTVLASTVGDGEYRYDSFIGYVYPVHDKKE